MSKTCPSCRLYNPHEADGCDRGYDAAAAPTMGGQAYDRVYVPYCHDHRRHNGQGALSPADRAASPWPEARRVHDKDDARGSDPVTGPDATAPPDDVRGVGEPMARSTTFWLAPGWAGRSPRAGMSGWRSNAAGVTSARSTDWLQALENKIPPHPWLR